MIDESIKKLYRHYFSGFQMGCAEKDDMIVISLHGVSRRAPVKVKSIRPITMCGIYNPYVVAESICLNKYTGQNILVGVNTFINMMDYDGVEEVVNKVDVKEPDDDDHWQKLIHHMLRGDK